MFLNDLIAFHETREFVFFKVFIQLSNRFSNHNKIHKHGVEGFFVLVKFLTTSNTFCELFNFAHGFKNGVQVDPILVRQKWHRA